MKQLEVQIMGQNYLLGCPEGGDARLLDAVGLVDAAMCKIRDAGKVKARDRIAVLAALNLAFELAERTLATYAEAEAATPFPALQPQPADQGGEGQVASEDPALSALLHRLDLALEGDS